MFLISPIKHKARHKNNTRSVNYTGTNVINGRYIPSDRFLHRPETTTFVHEVPRVI
jgi:hypothetical protein